MAQCVQLAGWMYHSLNHVPLEPPPISNPAWPLSSNAASHALLSAFRIRYTRCLSIYQSSLLRKNTVADAVGSWALWLGQLITND